MACGVAPIFSIFLLGVDTWVTKSIIGYPLGSGVIREVMLYQFIVGVTFVNSQIIFSVYTKDIFLCLLIIKCSC